MIPGCLKIEFNKSMVPVAAFKPHGSSREEGVVTEVGFDANGNGSLDAGEVTGSTGCCELPAPEE